MSAAFDNHALAALRATWAPDIRRTSHMYAQPIVI